MATTRPELCVSLCLLAGAWSLTSVPALAQTGPAVWIQPTLDLMATATSNANGLTATAPARRDVILSTGAGLTVNAQGANARADGQWRLTSVKYARNTQPSRVLPSGQINLHTDLYRKEAGVDASVASEQFASTPGIQPDGTNTRDTVTTTRLSISPFVVKQFDSDYSLTARLRRTWIHSDANSQSSNASDDRGTEDRHEIRWARRPVRFGYALDASYAKSPVFAATATQNDTSLTRRIATASLSYLVTPEFVVSAILGRESSDAEGASFSGAVRGIDLRWRPNERTQVKGVLKHSVFGREWDIDATRKTPWTTFGFNARRSAETLVPSSTSAVASANVSSPVVQANVQGAVLREAMLARMNFAARRDNINLSTGLSRSTPLSGSSVLQSKTKDRFFDTEIIHRLTPLSSLLGGLRWTRGKTVTANTGLIAPTRDFSARFAVDTRLSSNTTATMGFRRQITHSASTSSNMTPVSSSAVYVGLNHRF